jgi:hypothetical protein
MLPVPFAMILVYVDSTGISIILTSILLTTYFTTQLTLIKATHTTTQWLTFSSFHLTLTISALLSLDTHPLETNYLGWTYIFTASFHLIFICIKYL